MPASGGQSAPQTPSADWRVGRCEQRCERIESAVSDMRTLLLQVMSSLHIEGVGSSAAEPGENTSAPGHRVSTDSGGPALLDMAEAGPLDMAEHRLRPNRPAGGYEMLRRQRALNLQHLQRGGASSPRLEQPRRPPQFQPGAPPISSPGLIVPSTSPRRFKPRRSALPPPPPPGGDGPMSPVKEEADVAGIAGKRGSVFSLGAGGLPVKVRAAPRRPSTRPTLPPVPMPLSPRAQQALADASPRLVPRASGANPPCEYDDDPVHSPRLVVPPRSSGTLSKAVSGRSGSPHGRAGGSVAGDDTGERAEITQRELIDFRRMFHAFDHDGSGVLDKEEMGNVLRCLGVDLGDDKEAFNALLERFDEDGNGVFDFGEFIEMMLFYKHHTDINFHKVQRSRRHVEKSLRSSRLLPDDRWKWVWDIVLLIVTGTVVCFVTYRDATSCDLLRSECDLNRKAWHWVIEGVCTLVLLADVWVNINLAFVENDKLQEDRMKVAVHYATGWLAVDVLAALPIDLILGSVAGVEVMSQAWAHLRLLRLFRIRALFKMTNRTVIDPVYVYFFYNVVPVLHNLFLFALVLHAFACVWIWMQNDASYGYIRALYFVLYTITTVGYGDIDVRSNTQRVFACCIFLTGIVVNGVVIGRLTIAMQHVDVPTARAHGMRGTLAVLSCFDIPRNLQCEILSFQNHMLEHNIRLTHEHLIRSLPLEIQDQLTLAIRVNFISRVPMFARAHQECRVALAQSLTTFVFQPEEFIIVVEEQGSEMFFLAHGVCDIIAPNGHWIATIKKGGFFGEIALLFDGVRRTANIKALTLCDVFCLRKENFMQILRLYPGFREIIEHETIARQKGIPGLKPVASPGKEQPQQQLQAGRSPANGIPSPTRRASATAGALPSGRRLSQVSAAVGDLPPRPGEPPSEPPPAAAPPGDLPNSSGAAQPTPDPGPLSSVSGDGSGGERRLLSGGGDAGDAGDASGAEVPGEVSPSPPALPAAVT